MRDPEDMTVEEVENEYATLRKKSSHSGKYGARKSQLIKYLIMKRSKMELYKVSTKDVKNLPIADVVREYREILAAINKPHIDGWYGFSSGLENQIIDRQNQLKERMLKEFLGIFPEEKENENGNR